MTDRREPEVSSSPQGVNPGYAAFQIAKALRTKEEHGDPVTRVRATEKAAKWEAVLANILTGCGRVRLKNPTQRGSRVGHDRSNHRRICDRRTPRRGRAPGARDDTAVDTPARSRRRGTAHLESALPHR